MRFILMAMLVSLLLSACGQDQANGRESLLPNVLLQSEGEPVDSLIVVGVNMTVGWRAEDLILRNLTDSQVVFNALTSLYHQFRASLPVQRIALQAYFISLYSPQVISLQEVQTMLRSDTVVVDYLDTLLHFMSLYPHLPRYRIQRQELNRLTLDVMGAQGENMDIDFWEGNAMLVQENLVIVDSGSALLRDAVRFVILQDTIPSERGLQWTLVQGPGGKLWRIVNTHLEIDQLAIINKQQGVELNSLLWEFWQDGQDETQVLVADLNSVPGRGSHQTLTNGSSGLLDVHEYFASDGQAPSCCISFFTDPLEGFDRRLDYILARNFMNARETHTVPMFVGDAVSVAGLTGYEGPLWAGDHGLVTAVLRRR